MDLAFLPAVTVTIRRKEAYPNPDLIPEGQWRVYQVSLPNMPYSSVNISFRPLTPTVGVSPPYLVFEPAEWNVSQDLTIVALEDQVNLETPYQSGVQLVLASEDSNYNLAQLPDLNVTLEDNDEGKGHRVGVVTVKSEGCGCG